MKTQKKPVGSAGLVVTGDISPASTSPDLMPIALVWEAIGFCGICCRPAEAQQPGGLNARHIETQTPLCSTKEHHR